MISSDELTALKAELVDANEKLSQANEELAEAREVGSSVAVAVLPNYLSSCISPEWSESRSFGPIPDDLCLNCIVAVPPPPHPLVEVALGAEGERIQKELTDAKADWEEANL